MSKTLFDKIWDAHVVTQTESGMDVLYIDRHYIHEVTSPQAFDMLSSRGLNVFRTNKTTATADHNVPTVNQHLPIKEKLSAIQVAKLTENCQKFGIELYGLGHHYQGIVHVIGPELGLTLPGGTYVCGDSHTSTHGAFGTIAFGIGTSQVGHVLATQCLLQRKPKKMRISIDGQLANGVSAKDVILFIISKLGTGGGTGYFVEYAGSTIRTMSMEGRMTVCNMSIEMGARGGMIAADETTFNYLRNKEFSPKGEAWDQQIKSWQNLHSDSDAQFDKEYHYKASEIGPMISYGTNPGMCISVDKALPAQSDSNPSFKKAMDYMGLRDGQLMLGKPIDYVFIGSCTNARIEDLRSVCSVIQGKKKAPNVTVFVVPGSQQVLQELKKEGLDEILESAGFELREPGCSACLGMNEDKIPAGAYCVSTSNRNFQGRQGPGSRTILASPLTAAICGITGKISDIRKWLN